MAPAWSSPSSRQRSGGSRRSLVVSAGVVLCLTGGWPGLVSGVLVGAACTCWGLDNNLTALIDGMIPSETTLWKTAVAGTTNLLIGFASEPTRASMATTAAALVVGALCYGVSMTLYIAAAHSEGASRAQAIFATAPFVGAVLSWTVLQEPAQATQLVAGAHFVGGRRAGHVRHPLASTRPRAAEPRPQPPPRRRSSRARAPGACGRRPAHPLARARSDRARPSTCPRSPSPARPQRPLAQAACGGTARARSFGSRAPSARKNAPPTSPDSTVTANQSSPIVTAIESSMSRRVMK